MNMLTLILAAIALCARAPSAAPSAEIACCAAPRSRAAAQSETPRGQPETPRTEGATITGRVVIPNSWRFRRPDLTGAVLYLESHEALDAAPRQEEIATIAQKRKRFVPNFVVVSRGTVVEFPNWDDFDHNVFSRSEAAPAFDLDRYPRGQSKSRVFEKTGVVQVFCNIHPQMRATVVVTPNPYFATADEHGEFVIEHVPPGSYELVAHHAHCAEHRQPVEVTEAGAVVEITLREERASIIRSKEREGGYGVEAGLGIGRERLDLPVVEEAHPATTEDPG